MKLRSTLVSVLCLAACRAPEPGARVIASTPDALAREPGLTADDVDRALLVERALAERRAAYDRARRERGKELAALAEGLQPGPDRPTREKVARELGLDFDEVQRVRRRIRELALIAEERRERAALERFRAAHLEALARARATAASDAERERIDATIAEVEAGRERHRAAERAAQALADEIALVAPHLEELGLALRPAAREP